LRTTRVNRIKTEALHLRTLRHGLTVAILMSLLSACATIVAPDATRAQISASLAEMGAAANAHDIDRHVGFYARDSSTELIFNGEPIVGWDAIYAKQREWWQNGKTDVVYAPRGRPDVRLLSPDLAVTTLLMKSTRTMPDETIKEGNFAVSAIWKKLPEGWRIIYAHESTTH